MADAIEVVPGVSIPGRAVAVRAVRSSGPGGQNVNKVSSRIDLRVDLALVPALDDAVRRRLAGIAGRALGADGVLRVTAQTSRDRFRNLEDAREKVRRLVERALVVPQRRRATRPGVAAREGRLKAKKRAASLKAARRAPVAED